jgi:hypothetical protein
MRQCRCPFWSAAARRRFFHRSNVYATTELEVMSESSNTTRADSFRHPHAFVAQHAPASRAVREMIPGCSLV